MSRADSGSRLPVQKTYKLFVNGQFIRSESGRSFAAEHADKSGVDNIAHASRKDLREAVQAARKAQAGWGKRSAFNRSQILFRIAEVLESRRRTFEERLGLATGCSTEEAKRELDVAVDRTFWYAGWTDKFSQVLGGINPVATPFFNFTLPEPMGVVAILATRTSPLVGLVSAIAPVILSGNTCVVVVDGPAPAVAIELGEVVAASDVPGGVVNLLTGPVDELRDPAAGHMDVNAIAVFGGSDADVAAVQTAAAENIKRVLLFEDPDADGWHQDRMQSVYWIEKAVEWKTAWHPIGV